MNQRPLNPLTGVLSVSSRRAVVVAGLVVAFAGGLVSSALLGSGNSKGPDNVAKPKTSQSTPKVAPSPEATDLVVPPTLPGQMGAASKTTQRPTTPTAEHILPIVQPTPSSTATAKAKDEQSRTPVSVSPSALPSQSQGVTPTSSATSETPPVEPTTTESPITEPTAEPTPSETQVPGVPDTLVTPDPTPSATSSSLTASPESSSTVLSIGVLEVKLERGFAHALS